MQASVSGLKGAFGTIPLLSKSIKGENLYLYLVVSTKTMSATLIKEEEKVQWPVYYVSKRLLDAETRYLELDKLILALIIASRKLRPYFHAYTIEMLTNYPLHQALQKPEASRSCSNGKLGWDSSTSATNLEQQ